MMRLKYPLIVIFLSWISVSHASSDSRWLANSKGIKRHGFQLGYDRQANHNLYLCRTHLWGGRQIGVTWVGHSSCHIPYAKNIYVVDNFQVLKQISGVWQPYYGFFPKTAQFFGEGVKRVPLALCRGYFKGSLLPGKTWRGHNRCEVFYGKRAISLKRFSILIT